MKKEKANHLKEIFKNNKCDVVFENEKGEFFTSENLAKNSTKDPEKLKKHNRPSELEASKTNLAPLKTAVTKAEKALATANEKVEAATSEEEKPALEKAANEAAKKLEAAKQSLEDAKA